MEQGLQLVLLLFLVGVALWTGWRGYYPAARSACDPEAEQRARALLAHLLSDAERRQLAESGYLSVPSQAVAGRVYRVPLEPGWVEVYEDSRLAMKLCVEPVHPLPAGDVVLMHKLMIEGNEQGYLREANIVYLGSSRRSVWRGHPL